MHVLDLPDVEAFRTIALPFLIENEAQHCLLLGNLGNAAGRGCVVLEGTTVVAAATHLAGRAVCVSVGPVEAAGLLGRHTVGWAEVTGVVGPTAVAREFCVHFTRVAGRAAKRHRELLVHELTRVAVVERFAAGTMAVAAPGDAGVLVPWMEEFGREIREPEGNALAAFERRVGQGALYVWRLPDGMPVAMAGTAGATPGGIRINSVYTPPEHRGRGYATALVAAVSARQLAGGWSRCFLNTEVDNAVANAVYRRVGYVPAVGAEHYVFV